ncbi:MAG: carbohydrate-binding protein [Paludibacteraceae bacterium]|nr:carbohydrate-binding protein [Paludibacteraceae bacterium]
MKNIKLSLLCVFYLLVGQVCVTNAQGITGATGGKTIYVNNREVFVYAPRNITTDRPLVISMHGMNQDINYQKNQAKWETVADTANIVVAYPSGQNKSWDISGNKDTDYLIAIINKMYDDYKIDKKRVYLSGFSMGGMMTYHAMNKIPDYFAAFAPVSGYLFNSSANPSTRPVPIIHTHGTSDDVVQFSGVASVINQWKEHNNCTEKSETKLNNCATSTRYSGGDCDADIVLNALPGKGHWHSNDEACINTTREIWKFVRNYSTDCQQGPDIPQEPFKGEAAKIPGKIEAEEFDLGGEGKAYHDNDRQNRNGDTRNEGVDMSATAIGYTEKGEWLEYTVNVEETGNYDMEAYVASGTDGSSFMLYLDDKVILPSVEVPNTGDWSTYTTVKGNVGVVNKGEHVLKLEITGSWVDMDYMQFLPAGTTDLSICHPNKSLDEEYIIINVLGTTIGSVKNIHDLKPGLYILKNKKNNSVRKVLIER